MNPYRVIGVTASPYSVKMRAILRYRRIPHIWVIRTPEEEARLKDVQPLLMPVVEYPDGSFRTDSTPIALDLEERHPGDRSILPDSPGDAFLALLIEDMADEWLTKPMFHYRFAYAADRRYGPHWVIDDRRPDLADGGAFEDALQAFLDRQSGRMALVGCTPENAPVIEASYHRLLAIMERHVRREGFLFGSRPSLADFGLFGMLKTLDTDPTPMAIMRAEAPHTEHWVRRIDDASGVDGAWRGGPPSPWVTDLLRMAGDVYLPFLEANLAAVEAGDDAFATEIEGRPYSQGVFKYQAKCWRTLRAAYARLDAAERDRIAPLLDETGCLAPLAGGS